MQRTKIESYGLFNIKLDNTFKSQFCHENNEIKKKKNPGGVSATLESAYCCT